jgi:hypothetical protein
MASIPALVDEVNFALQNDLVDKYQVCSAYFSLVKEVLMTFSSGSFHTNRETCTCENWIRELPQDFAHVILNEERIDSIVNENGDYFSDQHEHLCFLLRMYEKYATILSEMK